MSIAPTLQRYLAAENIKFDLIPHAPTISSTRTAQVCRISGDRIAKAIVLKREGRFLLAILPASHHIRIADLKGELGGDVEMANEGEIEPLFPDCAHGAVPPIGQCYGLALLLDDSIAAQPDVYFEAGDHQTLLHVDHRQFAQLMAGARRSHFSGKLSCNLDSSVVWG